MSTHHDHRGVYKVIWGSLLILTIVTVWIASYDFGTFNILMAMLIATVKATLVCLFFMHLKYDNRLNQVVFIASFVFLAIFAGLTASDELFRPTSAKAKVDAIEAPAGNLAVQHEEFRKPSPELIAYGKGIYAVQCQTCHGAAGKGDGPAAGALDPRPRDFTSGEWKQGGSPSQVFKTVSEGIAGTGMSSFASLSIKDRWGAVHYIRSLSPKAPEETETSLKQSGIMGDGASASESPKLPISFAIDRMLEETK